MHTNREEWRPVFRFEAYQVSNFGRVKRIRILKEVRLADGYSGVNIRGKKFRIHRLVALAFIPNPYRKPQINHKDGDKRNNYALNLEWATAKENDAHARKNGWKVPSLHGFRRGKLTVRQVRFIRNSKLSHRKLADRFGVEHTTIGDIKRGQTWKHI